MQNKEEEIRICIYLLPAKRNTGRTSRYGFE